MKRVSYSVAAALILCVGLAVAFRRADRVSQQSVKAIHEAAIADSAEIARESERYWDGKNRLEQLENDEMRLKNDRLTLDIARLEGRTVSRARIDEDLKILQNDRAAIKLIDPDAPVLSPYELEARIAAHNRKYPLDQLAQVSDTIRQMEKFDSDIRAITDRENEQLRTLHAKQK